MVGGAIYVTGSGFNCGTVEMNEGAKIINNYGGYMSGNRRFRRCTYYDQRRSHLRQQGNEHRHDPPGTAAPPLA